MSSSSSWFVAFTARRRRGWRIAVAVSLCLVAGWWLRNPADQAFSEDPYDLEIKDHAMTERPTQTPTSMPRGRIKQKQTIDEKTTSETPRANETDTTKIKETPTPSPSIRDSIKQNKTPTKRPETRQPAQTTQQPKIEPPSKSSSNNDSTTPPRLSSLNQTLADQFVEKWCQLEGSEWFPSGESTAWQQRAPLFLLPGASDSGVTVLASLLGKHADSIPTIPPSNRLEFFLHFRGFLTIQQKTKVWSARQKMYARHYKTSALVQSSDSSSSFSFDATSHYLFAVPPQRILCVCPWIKIVVILRNPVDRVVASYKQAVKQHHWKHSFSEFIEQDFRVMREAGLLGDDRPKLGSLQEEDAWFRYLQLTRQGPVGQSLYELQLRHWFQAIRDMGLKPRQVMYFVRYEEWKLDPERQYSDMLRFLGLPVQSKIDWSSISRNSSVGLTNPSKQDEETLQKLVKFFAPYNRRLYRLLGGEWKECWDA